ncbi:MAG: sterol desaturase family protein [Bdellovibrionota bacterium]
MNENRKIGSGWWSGRISLFFALMCWGSILCFSFPTVFTSPGFREHYPIPFLLGLTRTCLILSYVLGLVGIILKAKNFTAIAALLLSLLGQIYIRFFNVLRFQEVGEGRGLLGLDWFVLNLLMLAIIFVPLERWRPLHERQEVFRDGWKLDLSYFAFSHVLVQFTVYLTILPAQTFFSKWRGVSILDQVPSLPIWLQFFMIMLVADFSEYWIHRAFHKFPRLWAFHAVHHGIQKMDWLASSRLHLVDIVAVRSLTFIPIFIINFSEQATLAYLSFVSIHAIFIHSNFKMNFGVMEKVLVFPRFHHWHHADEDRAIDKNFALHFPFWDKLFGSYLLPRDEWPKEYGISDGANPPETTFWEQFLWSFKKRS